MATISGLIKQQTYLYPRLHASASLLIVELLRDKKKFEKGFTSFNKIILVDGNFNEAIFDTMKSTTKLKYLHIGLKIVEIILKSMKDMDDYQKCFVLKTLLLENESFKNVLVKNVNMPKNQLNE